MYSRYRRQRPLALLRHTGTPHDLVNRYTQRVEAAFATESRQELISIALDVPALIANERNLFVAAQHLAGYGGEAPGPDGVRLRDLATADLWESVRLLGTSIAEHSYQPGPVDRIKKPKAGGNGHRTIELANAMDRVASRGLQQILSPWLEHRFVDSSFGFRAGRSTSSALLAALQDAERHGRYVWYCNDVKNAFDRVEVSSLLDLVEGEFGDEVRDIVEMMIQRDYTGISQGASASPMLLNLYLHHYLDLPWNRSFPGHSLFRYADDLLVPCPGRLWGGLVEFHLRKLLKAVGMQLKFAGDEAIVDLRESNVDWLGFRVQRVDERFVITIADRSWDGLAESLRSAVKEPNAVPLCFSATAGWLDALGPCYGDENLEAVVERIAHVARECGFSEPPGRRYIRERWRKAWIRWVKMKACE